MNNPVLQTRTLRLGLCLLVGLAWLAGIAPAADEPNAAAQQQVTDGPSDRAKDEADLGPGVSLTVYNQNFAVVKERRLMGLEPGTGMVKFPEVAATIVPESVQFSSLRPGGAKVLEQNYEFDLVSAAKLLHKYIDREIGIVGRDGSLVEGTLLASDAGQVILRNDNGIHLIPREKNIKDIRFSSLPEGLLTRPTLVWKVRTGQPGEHLVKVAYRADAINWRVDYRAVAAPDEKTMSLAGWVTINNRTGTTFHDAGLKLMAGDLHLVQDRIAGVPGQETRFGVASKAGGRGFEEKSFAEYHLYTLGRRTTLASAQTKQIELINVDQIPVAKRYLYRPNFGNRVGVILQFKNAKETCPGLGIPLPKGPFRVYLTDTDGQAEFVGRDEIDHTPKDEPVRIRIGYAFDLVAQRVQTANRRKAGEHWNEQDWRVTLRNHKSGPVTIVVEEPLAGYRNWKLLRHSHEWRKKDFRTLEFNVDVPADGETEITYTVRYTW